MSTWLFQPGIIKFFFESDIKHRILAYNRRLAARVSTHHSFVQHLNGVIDHRTSTLRLVAFSLRTPGPSTIEGECSIQPNGREYTSDSW
ncbi:hypothetical protein J6590_009041 [Homalodisca vitripennis]|nr:hypothetical protein J6590_009041 [Homalodisca vitripennis]